MISLKLVDRIEAARVILDPEVYNRISDDHSPDYIELPDIDYWAGYVGDEIASITTEDKFRDGCKVHFQVLKPYRYYANELADVFLDLVDVPVYAEIPACFMTTVNFAKNKGFKVVEIRPKAYLKYGKLHDRYLMRLDNELCH